MCVPLVVFLSALVLHSVSAGGAYCAKTARARAAALGLDYPGVHGAPDFYEMQPGTMLLRPQPYENNDPESDKTEPNMASYRQTQPEVRLLAVSAHKQAYPRRSESALGTHNPVRREYTTNQVLSFPRGQSVSNRKSNFEEVKHVAPQTRVKAPGLSDLVYWDPQGRSKPFSFVYNKHDLVVDESVPNRRGMSLSGLPLPQSQGHGTYQRGLTGFGLGGEVPVLASSRFPNKGHVRAMTGQTPVFGRQRIVLRDRLPQSFLRNLNVRQFVQGNPVLRPKPKSDRISR
ncbi:uncharacterized protein LOC108899440 [Lates calcarifer]|uniref:Uncharacterized protein LOC108899440 n=1 Tax=Lates calcarifer TaxID=8187 RepID=A0AAJ7QG81_LATCA|nr:uncharacterized protein LOC108899440 [Lates calcarifer]